MSDNKGFTADQAGIEKLMMQLNEAPLGSSEMWKISLIYMVGIKDFKRAQNVLEYAKDEEDYKTAKSAWAEVLDVFKENPEITWEIVLTGLCGRLTHAKEKGCLASA